MRAFACGRLTLYPRKSWERFLVRGSGKLAKRVQDANMVVIGGGAASWPADRLETSIAKADRLGLPILSERAALRRLKVLPPLPEEARPFPAEEIAQRSGLSRATLRLLVLFDVIEGSDGKFGFRALKAARAARLLLEKVSLGDIVAACHRVRSAFSVNEPLSELQLTAEHGRIVVSAGGRIADLDGQLRLELLLPQPDVDALLADADAALQEGEEKLAERALRQALAASPRDADALFELGSLLCNRGEFTEGLALLRKATRFYPEFADAWYNLGHALEAQGLTADAGAAYRRAIAVDPDYADPLFNLGMLSLEAGDFAEAIAQLEAYLRLDSRSEWAKKARKAIALARLSMVQAAG
jgi:tetratricopeptide (TPR) repeat protein